VTQRASLVLAACFFLSSLTPIGWAQDSSTEQPAGEAGEKTEKTAPESNDVVASKQRQIGDRLGKLEGTMERLANLLAKQNPEQAAKLRLAWQRSKSDQNMRSIQEIENLIREGYFTEALEKQKNLGTALQRILDILLDRDAEREALKEKIDELESIQKSIEALIQEETDQALESEKYADPEKALQRAAAAKARLKNLINRQNKLLNKTKSPPADAELGDLKDRLAKIQADQKAMRGQSGKDAQEDVAKKTAELAKDIEKYAKQMPEGMKSGEKDGSQDGAKGAMSRSNPADQAGNAASRASDAMKDAAARMQGGQPFDARQKDAEQELREAADALRRLEERRRQHDKDALAKDQERIRKDAERLEEDLQRLERGAPGKDAGSGEMGNAQKDMKQAEGSLSKGDNRQAVPNEQAAKKELENAYQKLEQFEKDLKELLKLPDYDKMAKKQDDTAEKTDDVLKKMDQAGQKPQPGGDSGEPTPGQGQVEGAKRAMQRGSQNLRNKSAKRANSDQQEAIDRLKKAQEELEEALRQLREEEQLMLLDAIRRRLEKMLREQVQIRTHTIALNLRVKDALKANRKPARADVDRGRQLGEGESAIAAEAEKLIEIMREEGSTVVIPDVVEDMRKDLDLLAARLRQLKAGEYTQEIQTDIINTLKELIKVIEEEQEKKQGKGGGGEPQEGDSEDNLLPDSAELKMLRSLQLRVNRRTNRFERLRDKDTDERGRLADKQNGVADLTRTMADKLNQAEDE
jgi:hypothetical protein